MSIIITGAAGFIGYHLSKRILMENISLIGTLSDIDENSSDFDNLDDVLATLRIEGSF